jgi:hypothetical protein
MCLESIMFRSFSFDTLGSFQKPVVALKSVAVPAFLDTGSPNTLFRAICIGDMGERQCKC